MFLGESFKFTRASHSVPLPFRNTFSLTKGFIYDDSKILKCLGYILFLSERGHPPPNAAQFSPSEQQLPKRTMGLLDYKPCILYPTQSLYGG